MDEIMIGDQIEFHAVCRYPTRRVRRIVTGFEFDLPTVRFAGCRDFLVRLSEISDVTKGDRDG